MLNEDPIPALFAPQNSQASLFGGGPMVGQPGQPGQPGQMPTQQLPPELENQIAMMAANAADSVLQLDEEKAKIMAGEKKDPQIELQEKEGLITITKTKTNIHPANRPDHREALKPKNYERS